MTDVDLAALVAAATPSMVELRHDLHAHPELAFAERRTSDVVARRLSDLGWALQPCPTPTGAVATLVGGRPGRRVLVRADIDALPVDEERDIAWRSTVPGVMHACGHDVHTAALLGVAEVLAAARADLAGEVTLVFQPAEESAGGAARMIEGGLLESHPADAAIGVHVTSLAPVGLIGTRAGVVMSAADLFTVELRGAGGHGAMASADGNVVLAASALAPRAAEAVDGLSFEGVGAACSINVIDVGTANNVVPRRARLEGTLRTFTNEQRDAARARLQGVVSDVARAHGVDAVLAWGEGVGVVRNDPAVTDRMMGVARSLVGDLAVEIPPVTPSDDVAEFLDRVPGCYLFVGGGAADGSGGMHHSPDFFVDDGALAVAARLLAAGAMALAER